MVVSKNISRTLWPSPGVQVHINGYELLISFMRKLNENDDFFCFFENLFTNFILRIFTPPTFSMGKNEEFIFLAEAKVAYRDQKSTM